MSRKHYISDEAFRRQKRIDYHNRYVATQLYVRRRWTEEEKDFLIKNGNTTLERELSEKLSRSIAAVERQKHRLRKKGLMSYPSEEETHVIIAKTAEMQKAPCRTRHINPF